MKNHNSAPISVILTPIEDQENSPSYPVIRRHTIKFMYGPFYVLLLYLIWDGYGSSLNRGLP